MPRPAVTAFLCPAGEHRVNVAQDGDRLVLTDGDGCAGSYALPREGGWEGVCPTSGCDQALFIGAREDSAAEGALAAARAVGWSALAEAMTQEERHKAAGVMLAPTFRPAVERFADAMERMAARVREEAARL